MLVCGRLGGSGGGGRGRCGDRRGEGGRRDKGPFLLFVGLCVCGFFLVANCMVGGCATTSGRWYGLYGAERGCGPRLTSAFRVQKYAKD